MYRISRLSGGGWDFETLGIFRTKTALLAYRNKQIGTDNPGKDGEWRIERLSVPGDDGACYWETIGRFEFIGQWSDDGNTHTIIGQREV